MSASHSKPLATPGAATPNAGAGDTASADRMGAPPTPPGSVQGVGKVTEPLKGTPDEQMAAMAAQLHDAMKLIADLSLKVNRTVAAPEPEVKRPTVAQAMADVENAETAMGRRPVLTTEGWYAHPHAYEQPNSDLAAALAKLGAGASLGMAAATSGAPKTTARLN